ncbi:hypothetical protein IPL85_05510 [Candidatus Saccharibacteria bacterium]|nr:MAG: hypothetical protein IPL85_05510 [Candidatus Saccharibacteria bacterium]
MAWHRKNLGTSPPQSAQTPGSKKDEKTASLEAALAKIQYPPPAETMVGAVIQANSNQVANTAQVAAQPALSELKPQELAPEAKQSDPLPAHKPKSVSPAPHANLPVPPPVRTQVQSNDPVQPAKTNHLGPLDSKELLALGTFLKTKKQKTVVQQSPIKTDTIAPTNPDPYATISTHIADKKKAEQARAAEEDENKWHVTKAKIHEPTLDIKKVYRYSAYWGGSMVLAAISYTATRIFGVDDLHSLLQAIIMLPIYLLGLYGVAGWIPVVLLYIRNRKD